MVLQMRADIGVVQNRRDPMLLQQSAGPDAGELQQLG
jgi:hypothetical protein